jgi:hypothetical protein
MATNRKQSAALNLTLEQRGFEIMSVLMWFVLFWLSEGGCVRLLWRWVCGQKAHDGVLQRTERISNNASSLTHSLSLASPSRTILEYHFTSVGGDADGTEALSPSVESFGSPSVGTPPPAPSSILPLPYISPTVPHFRSSAIMRVVGLLCTQHHCCARCRGLETQLNTV